jgi:diguanylate cyclase (GGDEF)-like protein
MSMGSNRLWQAWALAGVLAVGGYFLIPVDIWQSTACYVAIGVAAAGAVLVGVRIHRPAKPVLWYLLAAGQVLWSIGDLAFGVNMYVFESEATASFADVPYVLAYPVIAASLFVLIRGRTSRRDRAGFLDASIISTALALLTWAFIMRPTATDETLTLVERLVVLAYPAGDVLLIAMAARLFTTPGARTASYRLFTAGLIATLVADIAYAYVSVTGVYEGGLMDAGWLLSYVAWGACALHPSMRSLSETAPDRAVRLTVRRLVLLVATPVLAPAIFVAQRLIDANNIDWIGTSVGAVVLLALVLLRIAGLVAQVQDQAAQLDALAHNDALTGVPNRRAWDLELARHLANARRGGEPVVVALLDLDHFKRFNDRYGHQAGDRLLKEAAAAWRSQLRSGDLLARYGGEEFGICVTGLTLSAVVGLLERVQAATPLGQTFSAGVAAWSGHEAPERLVARADEALYRAKHAGRSCVIVQGADGVPAPAPIGVDSAVTPA